MSANGIGADPVRAFTLRTSECPLLTSACSREVRNAWSSRRYSRTTANVRPTPASVESKSALSSIPQSTRAALFGVADGEGVGLGGAVVGDGVGDCVGDADGLGTGEPVAVAVGDGVADTVALGDGDGVVVAGWIEMPLTIAWSTDALKPRLSL